MNHLIVLMHLILWEVCVDGAGSELQLDSIRKLWSQVKKQDKARQLFQ